MRKLIVLAGALLAVNVAFGQVKAAAPASKETSKPPQATEAQLQLDQKLAELKTLQAEIERLRRVAGAAPQNILLRVQIMDISRTKLEQLGYDLSEQGVATLLQGSAAAGSPAARAGVLRKCSHRGKNKESC